MARGDRSRGKRLLNDVRLFESSIARTGGIPPRDLRSPANSVGFLPVHRFEGGAYKFVDSSNRSPFDGDYNNVQPRIGFAFALNNNTAIRGGYGIFYSVNRDVVKGEVGYGWRSGSSVQWSRDSELPVMPR
jgi:hypothetical protein